MTSSYTSPFLLAYPCQQQGKEIRFEYIMVPEYLIRRLGLTSIMRAFEDNAIYEVN